MSDSHAPKPFKTLDSPGPPHPALLGAEVPNINPQDQFELLELIGKGGMGAVYRARDRAFDRVVAVKVIHAGLDVSRFVVEAKVTARLQHPGIPPVYALGTLPDGRPFLAMKLIKGHTLDELLKERPEPAHDRGRFVAVFEHVCQALGYAHSRNVVHRDLKPSNIMVGAFGEVQVMDWGLAKVLADGVGAAAPDREPAEITRIVPPATTEATQDGSVLGTIPYMPPEQAVGAIDEIDARSDVFSLGAVLCVVLTGRPPYLGSDANAVLRLAARAKLADCFARLDACGAEPDLIAVCKRCLSAERDDRPKDAGEVAKAIAELRAAAEERARAGERERLRASVALAGSLRRQYKFAEARAALDQTAALAKGRNPELLPEIERARADLAFAVRLDDIRYRKWVWVTAANGDGGEFNTDVAPPEYRKAFAECLVDLDTADVGEAAARIAASAIKENLVAALDDWAILETDEVTKRRLLDVTRRVEPGAWLDRVRDPAVWENADALQELAAEADAVNAPPAALNVLAWLMKRRDLIAHAFLTACRARHPADFELAFVHGQCHLENKDGKQIGPFEAARALRPEVLAVWINLGLAHFLHGDLGTARLLYQQVIDRDPEFAIAYHSLSQVLLKQGDPVGAIGVIRGLLSRTPNAFTHYVLAGTLEDTGDVAGALESYHQAIRLDPTHAWTRIRLGFLLVNRRDPGEAAQSFREAIRLDPTISNAHRGLGVALAHLRNWTGAIAANREAIRLDPADAQAHSNLGLALDKVGDVEGAIASYREAIRIDPTLSQPVRNLADTLAGMGDFEGVAELYEQAIRRNPSNTNYCQSLFRMRAKLGNVAEAVAAYRSARDREPNRAKVHSDLGDLLAQFGSPSEALAAYREAVRLDPGDASAQRKLAAALEQAGDADGAAEAYKRAIQLDPADAGSRESLFRMWVKRGHVRDAIAAHHLARNLDPNDPNVQAELGRRFNEAGSLSGAVTAYREAVRLNPRDARLQHTLGEMLRAWGDFDGAIAAYREAIALDPANKNAEIDLRVVTRQKADVEQGLSNTREAIRQNPADPEAHFQLGKLLKCKGDLDAALAAFETALGLAPDNAAVQRYLAATQEEKDKRGAG